LVDNEGLEMNNEDISKKGDVNKEIDSNEYFEDNSINEGKIIEAVDEEEIQKDESKEDIKDIKFVERILATIIDQIISLSVALVLLIVFDFTLKLLGFYIAERQPMFLIVYIIVNIIYAPICESTGLKKTIGRKLVLK
jgi:uncharacterized ion transporter superfamily protein YfcC